MGPVTIAFFLSVSLSSAGLLPFVGVGVGGELLPTLEEVLRVVSRPARTITQRISCMENITKSPATTREVLHNGKERLHEVNEAVRLVQIRSTVQFSQ